MSAEFRQRAARLKLEAYFFFSLIFPLFGAGVYVLYNASQITSFDIAGGGLDSKLNEASVEFEKLNTKSQEIGQTITWYIQKAQEVLNPFWQELTNKYPPSVPNARPHNISSDKPLTVKQIADEILSTISQVPPEPDGRIQAGVNFYRSPRIFAMTRDQWSKVAQELQNIDLSVDVAELQKLYEEDESNTNRRTDLTNLMATIRQTKANANVAKLTGGAEFGASSVSETARLVQTSITRFGTLAIISFLVGIFISLYRYNVRLAGYYQARADALALMSTSLNTVGFPTLSTTLTPQLDFGKVPRTPTGEVIDLLHALRPDTPKAKEG
jgi:hypothetical protein